MLSLYPFDPSVRFYVPSAQASVLWKPSFLSALDSESYLTVLSGFWLFPLSAAVLSALRIFGFRLISRAFGFPKSSVFRRFELPVFYHNFKKRFSIRLASESFPVSGLFRL